MSSILKALKRIEGQSPPPEAFPALPQSVDAKQAVNTIARKRWRQRRVITLSLVLLIIAVTAVIVFQQRKFLIAIIFPPGPPATHQQKNQAAGDKSKIFRAKIPPAAVKQASKKSGPPRSVRLPKKTSRQKYTPSKKSIAGKRTASSKPAAAAVKKPEARIYAKLADSNIKLQALAWSKDAARRIAVINGRIVREGESVEGYQINQIRQEDVVISDSKQSWRLEFGLKR